MSTPSEDKLLKALGIKTRGPMVRYGGAYDHLLRHALWELWKFRCYWCMEPKDFSVIQIDHIIPKSVAKADLSRILHEFAIREPYDLDDPRNLAPICPPCNGPGGKGSKVLADMPALRAKLESSERLRSAVIRRVLSFHDNSELHEALRRISDADLTDADVRSLLLDYAPAISRRLALVVEGKADYVAHHWPIFASQLEHALRSANEPHLADSVSRLRIVKRCGCSDYFCQSFYTAAPPDGSYGAGHRNLDLEAPWPGYLILDVVHDDIVFVEVLDRQPLD